MTAGDLKRLFGAAIKTKRSEMQISQEELADRAGLHRTYISDVERGARNLSLESIEKLATALELSVSNLFRRAKNGNGAKEEVEILLIEDEPEDVELTLRAFRKMNFTNPVHVATDGAEALDFIFATGRYILRRNLPRPGVILLDLKLPKISGLEVLRRLRNDLRTKDLPVVVLTASEAHADADECQELGVDAYIVKPVNFRNFTEVTPRLRLSWALIKALPDPA